VAGATGAQTSTAVTSQLTATAEKRGSKWHHVVLRDGEQVAKRVSETRYGFATLDGSRSGAKFSTVKGDVRIVEVGPAPKSSESTAANAEPPKPKTVKRAGVTRKNGTEARCGYCEQ
jgi:hypothetical protein